MHFYSWVNHFLSYNHWIIREKVIKYSNEKKKNNGYWVPLKRHISNYKNVKISQYLSICVLRRYFYILLHNFWHSHINPHSMPSLRDIRKKISLPLFVFQTVEFIYKFINRTLFRTFHHEKQEPSGGRNYGKFWYIFYNHDPQTTKHPLIKLSLYIYLYT